MNTAIEILEAAIDTTRELIEDDGARIRDLCSSLADSRNRRSNRTIEIKEWEAAIEKLKRENDADCCEIGDSEDVKFEAVLHAESEIQVVTNAIAYAIHGHQTIPGTGVFLTTGTVDKYRVAAERAIAQLDIWRKNNNG